MSGINQSVVIGVSLISFLASTFVAGSEDVRSTGRAAVSAEPAQVAVQPISVHTQTTGEYDSTGSVRPISYHHRCPPPARGRFFKFKERCRAKYWGYPEEFCEPSLGASVEACQMAQIANGRAAQMGLYQYDFLPDSAQLNPRGKAQLGRLARWLVEDRCAIFIEPTANNAALDELRREAIWGEISSNYSEISSDQVLIGRPGIRDVGAVEALLLERNRLEHDRHTRQLIKAAERQEARPPPYRLGPRERTVGSRHPGAIACNGLLFGGRRSL